MKLKPNEILFLYARQTGLTADDVEALYGISKGAWKDMLNGVIPCPSSWEFDASEIKQHDRLLITRRRKYHVAAEFCKVAKIHPTAQSRIERGTLEPCDRMVRIYKKLLGFRWLP